MADLSEHDLVRALVDVAMRTDRMEWQQFADHICYRTHNTEQQQVFRLLHFIIETMAKKDRFVDLRNEAAHEWAKKVVAADPDPYFPFI